MADFHGVAALRLGVYGVPASLFMREFWEGSMVRLSSLIGENAQNLRRAVACFPVQIYSSDLLLYSLAASLVIFYMFIEKIITYIFEIGSCSCALFGL